ncbi:MAG: ATP-binding cassette domain-containing protein [Microscillaceae bacterium]|nr:ATP-binding cassette domain-containing protein [Microscillaceae bacterium]
MNPTNPLSAPKPRINREGLRKAWQIFGFLRPYRGVFILGMLFLVFSTLTSLTIPLLAGKFLDVAVGNGEGLFDSIPKVAMIFGGVLVLQAILSFFRIYLFAQVSENAMADIRANLYGRIITLPLAFFEQKRVGELNSRITSDVTQLQDALSFTLAEFFRQVLTILLGTTYLFIVSTKLTLFMVSTFPLLVLLAIFFGRFIRKLAKQSQDALAASNVVVEETFQAIHAVKSFTNEGFELKRYRQALQQVVKTALRVAQYRGGFASFVIAILFGALMMVLAYGATLVSNGELSVGDLTTFIVLSAFIGGSMGGMSELYGQLQKAVGASERMLEILSQNPEVILQETKAPEKNAFQKLKGDILFENVHFAYPTRPDLAVLQGLHLEIRAGQKVALVGYSGVGKSTIVQLLGRYYTLAEGQIRVDGQALADYDLLHLRQNIGLVPQEVLLFGGSIRENIAYGRPEASEEEIQKAAQQANAWEFIASFPEQLDTVVGERGIKLSGGQRQRIAIARAILKNPAILVLDEATSSLDANSEKLVQEALHNLMQNRTTIIIAHRLATIRQVDKIYVIDKGQVVEAGTHESLSTLENGIYRQLVKLQFEQHKEPISQNLV